MLQHADGKVEGQDASTTAAKADLPEKESNIPSAYNSVRKTGFARRLSARVKHLPPAEDVVAENVTDQEELEDDDGAAAIPMLELEVDAVGVLLLLELLGIVPPTRTPAIFC